MDALGYEVKMLEATNRALEERLRYKSTLKQRSSARSQVRSLTGTAIGDSLNDSRRLFPTNGEVSIATSDENVMLTGVSANFCSGGTRL